PMIGSLGITCFGSAQHALGVAALTSRQLDLAVEHLTAAVQHNLALAHWPALVASRQRLAQAHALRGSPGDADAARRALDEAGAAQRVLDPEAIAEYRSRLKRLDTEIDELEPDRARQARAERDWLVAQLSSAAGFGGRTRAFPDQPERARVAVGKAIRRALA